jgi:hypothetical protein
MPEHHIGQKYNMVLIADRKYVLLQYKHTQKKTKNQYCVKRKKEEF